MAADIEQLVLVEALDGERLMLPGEREKFEAFKPSKTAQYQLLGGIDAADKERFSTLRLPFVNNVLRFL